MSYDAHITRADFWALNDGRWIMEDEWARAATSAELSPRGRGVFVAEGVRADGDDAALIWRDGNITTEDPDRETLRLMKELAKRLAAVVQGDDGDAY